MVIGQFPTTAKRLMTNDSAAVNFTVTSFSSITSVYRPGDVVPMSKMVQYYSVRIPISPFITPTSSNVPPFSLFLLCDIKSLDFMVSVHNRLIPMAKPTGYTGADPYKILYFSFTRTDIEIHPDIRKQFWDPQRWPKHVLVRYTWGGTVRDRGDFWILCAIWIG
ncbi:hypothetical protein SLEP1_g14715 [Rubroshorea leprosula]|nr:hypothetical protein SLEP1_g14715 [Rubroshorea leprosula]